MSRPQNPTDALQNFQLSLQKSALQYRAINMRLEEQILVLQDTLRQQELQQQILREQQNLLYQQHYRLRQKQVKLAAIQQRMQIGNLIRSRRAALNVREEELARFCDIDISTLYAIENGTDIPVDFDKVLLLMQALGLQLSAYPQI